LFFKINEFNEVKFPNDEGMDPVKLLLDISNVVKPVRFPNFDGISLPNWFDEMFNRVKDVRDSIQEILFLNKFPEISLMD